MAPTASFPFKVTRKAPELIAPAKPTSREYKLLSDIDDQEVLRYQMPSILIYHKDSSLGSSKDPVKVIREAIAKTLVFYYPFAGRLRETAGRKLGVDCTGEGVMFIEADADVRIEEFAEIMQPPFPGWKEFIHEVPGFNGVLNCPLLLIQVTRMKCGGFIFANRSNHTICDAFGLIQFLKGVAEIARGKSSLSVPPIWRRELLSARDSPHVTDTHRAYDVVPVTNLLSKDKVNRTFFLGSMEIGAIRSSFPLSRSRKPSTFEILTAWLWRCHTVALELDIIEEEVRLLFVVSARGKFQSPPLPAGYYGNAFAFATAVSPAGKLCENSLGYALELVMKAKDEITEEHMRSLTDFLVMKGRPHITMERTFSMSDVTKIGFRDVDFGWGKPAYGGPVRSVMGASFYIPITNANGEFGIGVPICLPRPAMERFELAMAKVLKSGRPNPGFSSSLIKSAL